MLNLLLIVGVIVLAVWLLSLIFDVLIFLEKTLGGPTTVNVNMMKPVAPSVNIQHHPEKSVVLNQKIVTREEKAEKAKKDYKQEKKLIEDSGMEGDEKKMALRHAERQFSKKMKALIDA